MAGKVPAQEREHHEEEHRCPSPRFHQRKRFARAAVHGNPEIRVERGPSRRTVPQEHPRVVVHQPDRILRAQGIARYFRLAQCSASLGAEQRASQRAPVQQEAQGELLQRSLGSLARLLCRAPHGGRNLQLRHLHLN